MYMAMNDLVTLCVDIRVDGCVMSVVSWVGGLSEIRFDSILPQLLSHQHTEACGSNQRESADWHSADCVGQPWLA